MSEAAEGKKGRVLWGRYKLGRMLGQGNFGRVHVARDLRTGRSVAVKVVKKEKVVRSSAMVEQMKREITVMKRVSHPNIVELHEVMATRSRIYLALELVRGGDLFEMIRSKGRVSEDVACRYFQQLIFAVDFCHSRGVCHRDLKPENLLLDRAGNLKVADFGFSALVDHAHADGLLHTLCGTRGYTAPEVRRDKGYDGAKADLWSCGVILYMLLAGGHPFPDDNIAIQYKKMQCGQYWCPPWFSMEAGRLVSRLLDPKPATRITVAELVETPWFQKTSTARPLRLEPAIDPVCEEEAGDKDEPKTLNAFHLISLSEGFDLSPLFEGDSGRGQREGGMLFATREPANSVVSRLEEVAARGGGRMRVTKSGAWGVHLEGTERGRSKGRLTVAVEIFSVASSVLLIDVKKKGGDTLEYRSFCSEELQPALQDMVLTTTA